MTPAPSDEWTRSVAIFRGWCRLVAKRPTVRAYSRERSPCEQCREKVAQAPHNRQRGKGEVSWVGAMRFLRRVRKEGDLVAVLVEFLGQTELRVASSIFCLWPWSSPAKIFLWHQYRQWNRSETYERLRSRCSCFSISCHPKFAQESLVNICVVWEPFNSQSRRQKTCTTISSPPPLLYSQKAT